MADLSQYQQLVTRMAALPSSHLTSLADQPSLEGSAARDVLQSRGGAAAAGGLRAPTLTRERLGALGSLPGSDEFFDAMGVDFHAPPKPWNLLDARAEERRKLREKGAAAEVPVGDQLPGLIVRGVTKALTTIAPPVHERFQYRPSQTTEAAPASPGPTVDPRGELYDPTVAIPDRSAQVLSTLTRTPPGPIVDPRGEMYDPDAAIPARPSQQPPDPAGMPPPAAMDFDPPPRTPPMPLVQGLDLPPEPSAPRRPSELNFGIRGGDGPGPSRPPSGEAPPVGPVPQRPSAGGAPPPARDPGAPVVAPARPPASAASGAPGLRSRQQIAADLDARTAQAADPNAREEAKWNAIMRLGLGMLASRQRNPFAALGEGGIVALQGYGDDIKAQRDRGDRDLARKLDRERVIESAYANEGERDYRQQNLQLQREKMAQDERQHGATLAESRRSHDASLARGSWDYIGQQNGKPVFMNGHTGETRLGDPGFQPQPRYNPSSGNRPVNWTSALDGARKYAEQYANKTVPMDVTGKPRNPDAWQRAHDEAFNSYVERFQSLSGAGVPAGGPEGGIAPLSGTSGPRTGGASTPPLPLPADRSQLVAGQAYQTRQGPAIYRGNGQFEALQ